MVSERGKAVKGIKESPMSVGTSTQSTKQRISELLDELTPKRLQAVEQFVRFLRQQGPLELGSRYPTVDNPASSLSAWLDLIPEGYDGDALADTEALYDEV
jgi:hypothetical protein